jgi:hypothetical protein
MSFGGGGSGALPNHEHTLIAQDGGPLDFSNTTVASLSQGDMTFSDGAALQALNIGNPAEVLRTNPAGTAPEWGSAGGATVTTVSDTLGATFSSSSLTFVDITNWTLTKPTITGGECMTVAFCSCEQNGQTSVSIAIEDNSVITSRCETMRSNVTTDDAGPVCVSDISDANGNTIQMQGRGNTAGIWSVIVDANLSIPKVTCFGVG